MEDSNDSQKVVQCVSFPLNIFKLIFGSLTPGKCVEATATVGGIAVAEVSLLETGGSLLETGASLLEAGVSLPEARVPSAGGVEGSVGVQLLQGARVTLLPLKVAPGTHVMKVVLQSTLS